jgi:sec-independent protein translocase protein TatA
VPGGDLFISPRRGLGSVGLTWKILLIVAIVLLLFGSSRLPSLARAFGQSITEFKRGIKEIEGPQDDTSNRPR